jgi:glycogen debranching enzyme
LFRGGACFQDGVAAYPGEFTTPEFHSGILDWVDAFPDKKTPVGFGLPMKALSTNCLYYNAYQLLPQMAEELGWTAPIEWKGKGDALKAAINLHFWDPESGNYRYLVGVEDTQDRQEGFGNAFAVLFGVADDEQTHQIVKNQASTSHGIPCLWPTYERYASPDGMSFGRHSGTIWPQVNAAWADATLIKNRADLAFFELNALADKACRDMQFAELYHPVTGKPYGGLQEHPEKGAITTWEACSRQSWCASGYLHMVWKVLFGMHFSKRGITLKPNLPDEIDSMSIKNLRYRNSILEIRVSRGQAQPPACIPADAEGNIFLEITS